MLRRAKSQPDGFVKVSTAVVRPTVGNQACHGSITCCEAGSSLRALNIPQIPHMDFLRILYRLLPTGACALIGYRARLVVYHFLIVDVPVRDAFKHMVFLGARAGGATVFSPVPGRAGV